MPDGGQFQYDLFISYSSNDRAWAEKLYNDIRQLDKRVKCFWDRPELRQGEPWPQQLRDALKASRHLVVLWSNHAFQSGWVRQEKEAFREAARFGQPGWMPGERRLIMVLLEGEDVTESDIHQFTLLKEANVYAEAPVAPAAFSPNAQQAWDTVMGGLVTITQSKGGVLPIPVLVVATNEKKFAKVDPNDVPGAGPCLNDFAAKIGRTLDEIKNDYGPTAADWRPFGMPDSIATMVKQLESDVNASLRGLSVELRIADMLGPDEVVVNTVLKLQTGLCLVVVDPVSLYDLFLATRFRWLNKVLENELAIVSVASPRKLDPLQYVRDQLQAIAKPIFDPYYTPPVPTALRYANCVLNVCDSKDIQRLLLVGLGRVVPPPTPVNAQPAFTNFGNQR